MATKKKGCGFLIAALILLIIGGGIAFLGIKSAADEIKNFASIANFKTPDTGTFTAEEEGAITVWLAGGNDTTLPAGTKVNAKDVESGKFIEIQTQRGSSRINDKLLVAAFNVEKGKKYEVSVNGLSNGREIVLSSMSADAALKMVGKGLGGVAGAGVCGFIALILGIIGLVKLVSSPKNPTAPPPVAAA